MGIDCGAQHDGWIDFQNGQKLEQSEIERPDVALTKACVGASWPHRHGDDMETACEPNA